MNVLFTSVEPTVECLQVAVGEFFVRPELFEARHFCFGHAEFPRRKSRGRCCQGGQQRENRKHADGSGGHKRLTRQSSASASESGVRKVMRNWIVCRLAISFIDYSRL